MHSKMIRRVAGVVLAGALLSMAQETPRPMVETYSSLADAILAVKKTEENFVKAMLDGYKHGAEAYFRAGQFERAAAEMALFANEGDNAIGGIRKRLLEGGHHHHADGEAKGIYEPGYVVVTKEAKREALAASAAMRSATDDAARKQAWESFTAVADALLGTK